MKEQLFSREDLCKIKEQGLAPEDVIEQIDIFKKGFPYSKLVKPCTEGDGILALDESKTDDLAAIYSEAEKAGRCMKFVPASGAASRMFKQLLSFYSSPADNSELSNAAVNGEPAGGDILRFIDEIKRFPFYSELKEAMSKGGLDIDSTIETGDIKTVLDYLLFQKGLDLSGKPKGLIPFHRYNSYSRTPFEEHLVEALTYTRPDHNNIPIHFTVAPQHEEMIRSYIRAVSSIYEKNGLRFDVSYSCQKKSTDTIAVDMENKPFRDEDNNILFRPGGHGALLDNLSGLEGDIVFIKNIDNVTRDRHREITGTYKKVLGGCLVSLQKEIFGYLAALERDNADDELIDRILDFISDKLSVMPPQNILKGNSEARREYAVSRLNRPLRVCGMVRNEGEPGGGPFWVEQYGKGISVQIVEASQIDAGSRKQAEILKSSTHFNPVDLVCGLKDFKGKSFDLKKFVNPDTGFISKKSKDGRELKALELPGLWNGSMAYWNTVFIEVPSITFNPVKTVFDLLRAEHQPAEGTDN